MRQIGSLSEPAQARLFADYLLSQGIATKLDESPEGVTIWIRDEDHLPQAREHLAAFQANPQDARFQAGAQQAEVLRREIAAREAQYRRNTIDMRRRWGGAGDARSRPLTIVLIGASILITIISGWGNVTNQTTQTLLIEKVVVQNGQLYTVGPGLGAVRRGEIWRLVTPIFMHANLIHLLFNMLWLYDLGGQIESKRGSMLLGFLVLATAIPSDVAQFSWHGPIFLGMSGVVYGLLGYIWMQSRYEPRSGLYVTPNTVFWMVGWFFLCWTGYMGPVANVAHGAGLIVGMILGYAPVAWRKLSRGG